MRIYIYICLHLSSLFCENNSEKEVFLNLSFEPIQTNETFSVSLDQNMIF